MFIYIKICKNCSILKTMKKNYYNKINYIFLKIMISTMMVLIYLRISVLDISFNDHEFNFNDTIDNYY